MNKVVDEIQKKPYSDSVMKNTNKIERYTATDKYNRIQATLTVWVRRMYNEARDKYETVRWIVSMEGADMGSQKVWTRGLRIEPAQRTWGLPEGLKWEKA